MENFITNIYIKECRNIKDLTIPLSKDKRQHLILTGKNGVGKTSLLEMIKHTFQLKGYSFDRSSMNIIIDGEDNLINMSLSTIAGITENPLRILVAFEAKREANLNLPKGIEKVELNKSYSIDERANSDFMQYLVNLKAERSFARDDGEKETVIKIDAWFERFGEALKQIFDTESLELKFDRKTYDFTINTADQLPFSLTNLSDGYAAIMSIVSELILRMEAKGANVYDVEGVVLIDEIETHLHVDLQKKILPFLTSFFPKIQFIVTTHSPFVLSSISNAVVCDLEKNIITEDLSSYSYDAIIESYYGADKYSVQLKEKVVEYEVLATKPNLTPQEKDELLDLEEYLEGAPTAGVALELKVKLDEIQAKKKQ